MGVAQTSRAAYRDVRDGLGPRQLKVLEVIERSPGGITNNELAHELRWPINCVTPRVFELRSAGVVALVGKRPDRWTGKRSCVWGRVQGAQLEFEGFA
ncbi:MAG: winged helix-turn-helix domain-containing protein [Candidatus Omnitrophica bacterium]|nr:winged helix-turn-helix domain-containing protein [Candidatus Omnitrophota bacterium]